MRTRHLPRDPLGERNPFQVYLLILSLATGIPLMFGIITAGTIESTLPRSYTFLWGLMLTIGAGCTLAGMYWPGDARTGLLLKRFGLTALGFAATVYACALFLRFGSSAFLLVGIVGGYAVACWRQAYRVSQAIRKIIQGS